MARAIFISYRRDDSEGETGRLFDDLVRSFGDDSVFMDVAGIDPGKDFRTAIDSNVASCGVLLAVIGPHWVSAAGSAGARRLDDPNDFVALEIASALKRNIAVIPVLVHDAKMPYPDQLPDTLKDLAYRNSVEITHTRWNSDVQLLTNALKQYVSSTRISDRDPVHATVSVQLPPPHDARPPLTATPRAGRAAYASLGTLAVLAILGTFFYARHTALKASAPVTARAEPASAAVRPAISTVPAPAAATPLAVAAAATPAAAKTATAAESPAVAAAPAAPIKQELAPDPARAAVSALLGTWSIPGTPPQENIAQVAITDNGSGSLVVQAWGACQPVYCDWGTQSATFSGSSVVSRWQFSPPTGILGGIWRRFTTMTLSRDGEYLDLTMDNIYTNGMRRSFRYRLVRGAHISTLAPMSPQPPVDRQMSGGTAQASRRS